MSSNWIRRQAPKALLLSLGLVVPGLCLSQPLQPLHFDESLNPEVRVSGATRGGILINALDRPTSLDRLLVRLPETLAERRLCLNLVTRDGRYQAQMEFDVPESAENFVELAYPTRFQTQLLQADQPYLAVLASLRKDCSGADALFVPVAWHLPDGLQRLQILVNAGHNDAQIIIPTRDGTRKTFPCERIDADARIAFDRLCTIELSADLDLLGAEIQREDLLFNPLPPVALPIGF